MAGNGSQEHGTTGRVDPAEHAHRVDPDALAAATSLDAVTSAEEKEQLAEEIAHESPEGRPADARSSPALLRGEVLMVIGGLAAVGLLLGVLVRPAIGLAFAGIALMAIVLNPVVVTTLLRVKDREVVKQKLAEDPGATGLPRG